VEVSTSDANLTLWHSEETTLWQIDESLLWARKELGEREKLGTHLPYDDLASACSGSSHPQMAIN
jgi:hypothetical protein